MRLLFACSELGLGHVSRIVPLGKRLEQNGHEAFFYSGGRAYEILKKEFKNAYKCTPISWYENGHGIMTSASLLNIFVPLPFFNLESSRLEIKNSNAMETINRYYDLRGNIHQIKPDLLIADGDINALRLARKWKIPSVYIANMIRPSYGFSSFLSPGERLVEMYVKGASKIIVPDNPPPFTISEFNIGNLDKGLSDKLEFVGGFEDPTFVQGAEDHIFVPISGPVGTRSKLLKTLLPILEKVKTKTIISLGMPGKKVSAQIGNCQLHTWLSSRERQECMQNAKYVIFSGGHITCFETVKYAKPSICIPTQPEQAANGAKLQQLKCSIKVKNQKELGKAIQAMDRNYESFRENMLALNRFSSKYYGLDRAVEIVENFD